MGVSRNSAWFVRAMMFLVVCGTCESQELTVKWNDPAMGVLASTYDSLYTIDWRGGLDSTLSLQQANVGDISVVNAPSMSGHKALRVSISKSEDFSHVANGLPRAELVFPAPVRFTQGRDYLVRWSTYIPQEYRFDSSEIIAQIHQGPASGSPPIMLTITGGDYTFSERGSSESGQGTTFRICCAAMDQGKWIHWALRYVPDAEGTHASTQFWKDGTSVYASRGTPNAYPRDNASFLKMGLYIPGGWKQADPGPIVLFYGPVSVGRR